MTEARLIRPISYHGMDHISAIWCFWRSRMSSMSWNQVPFIPSGIIFVSLFEWSSDILRKMDFSSVWQVYKAVLVLVLIDTSSAFKVKIENLSWNWDFWSFEVFCWKMRLKMVEKNVRVGHILKLWEIFLTEWSSFVLWIIDWTIFSIWSPLIVHSSVPCTTLL